MTIPDHSPRGPHPLVDPLSLAYELHGLVAWFERVGGRFTALEEAAFATRLRRAARQASELAGEAAARHGAACDATAVPAGGPVPDLLGEFLARCARSEKGGAS